MTAPEFSRRIRLDEISAMPRVCAIAAEAAERALLAHRFGLADLDRLDAEIALSREVAGVRAKGWVRAAVNQVCVISGEPVAAQVDEAVEVLFTFREPEPGDEDVELGAEDCDTLPMEGDWIDIGELAAETMSLALDPYPKLSDAELAEYRRLLVSEEEAAAAAEAAQQARNPFSVLKKQP